MDTQKNNARRPEVSWVPVRDSRGRTHMEARWTTSSSRRARAAA